MMARLARELIGKPPLPLAGTVRRVPRVTRNVSRATRATTPSLLLADVQRLVHELQIHEIELRMQNEELMRAHRLELPFGFDPRSVTLP